MTLIAALLTVSVLQPGAGVSRGAVPWWLLAVAYFLASVFVAHLTLRNQAYTVTLSEIPLVLGLVAGTPSVLIAGGLTGTTLALILYRRQSPVKVVFNLATLLVEIDIAVVTMQALLGGHPVNSAGGSLAALAGTVAASAAGHLLVAAAVLAATTALPLRQMASTLVFGLTAAALNSLVGILALQVIQHDPQLAALLVIPCLVLAAAYRSYLTERAKHRRVRQLFEASGALHRSRGVDASVATLLATAREMFNAELAELILLSPASPVAGRCFRLGRGQDAVSELDRDDAAIGELVTQRRPVLLTRDGPGGALMEDSWRGGMAVSIAGERGVTAVLVVANRQDSVSTFQRGDLELLEAFAGPASVSLENGRLHAELEHRAFHDSLTRLANRSLLAQRLQAAITHGPRGSFSVLLLDIDDFKTVNDTLGHPVGDRLLIEVARRITACLDDDDTAARLGGDEFAIMVRSGPSGERATAVANRILESLRSPFSFGACEVAVRGSVGVVTDNPSVVDVDDLLGYADIAMYRAKSQGKDRCVVFEPIMHVEVMARHQLRADLERALAEHQLRVHFQPIVLLHAGEVIGAEALVRWTHPVRGNVPPDEFIPLAEESGLVLPLGRFVLQEACHQLMRWRRELPALRLSVNVSARQLQDADFVDDVITIFKDAGVEPTRITLEVTEHVVVDDERAVSALRELRALGVRIAVDDFGTGYSSLSCLGDLPIDSLKVAKPFVDRLTRSDDDRALALSVVGLANSLRLDTVAEGIERPEQAEMLRAGGCRCGQGFLYSRALPAEDFVRHVRRARFGAPVVSVAS